MTSSVIAKLLVRHPFQPFTLRLPNDIDVLVEEPSQVKHQPGSQIIIVKNKDGTETIVDLYLVACVDVHRPKRGAEK
jgi:hypothetical protein